MGGHGGIDVRSWLSLSEIKYERSDDAGRRGRASFRCCRGLNWSPGRRILVQGQVCSAPISRGHQEVGKTTMRLAADVFAAVSLAPDFALFMSGDAFPRKRSDRTRSKPPRCSGASRGRYCRDPGIGRCPQRRSSIPCRRASSDAVIKPPLWHACYPPASKGFPITQQFNTTTSMGRLTLNVLLSFAQFEREVVYCPGHRI